MSAKRGLGKGISALMSNNNSASPALEAPVQEQVQDKQAQSAQTPTANNEYRYLPIEFLQPGLYQPRRSIATQALEELAASIQAQGVMQPLVVRRVTKTHYEIIAGERRWRASQLAGLTQVPCIIREVSNEGALAIAIIENIQREDLSPMEQAMSMQRLKTEFDLTHQQISDAVGRSRTHVTNLLRLLNLHESVKQMLDVGDLEVGHAKCLLAIDHEFQVRLAKQIIDEAMSVRATEIFLKRFLENQAKPASVSSPAYEKVNQDIALLQNSLAEKVGADVNIHHKPSGKGRLVIKYTSIDELEGILAHIS